MIDLTDIVDDAVKEACEADWADKNGLKVTPQRWGYGTYLNLSGEQAWFGLDFESWARYRDTPLWLWFTPNALSRMGRKKRRLEPLRQRDPPELLEHEDRGGLVVPVKLPVDVEHDVVLDAVVKRLREVADLIRTRKWLIRGSR